MAALAKQTRSPMHVLNHRCRIYLADGSAAPESLDSGMDEEWNALLDKCKLLSQPQPAVDASLGKMLRRLVRDRRDRYTQMEVPHDE